MKRLGPGWRGDDGFLLSDDVFWSAAFHRFAREQRRPYTLVDYDFGAMRK